MPRPILLLVEDNADDEALVRRALQLQASEASIHVAHDGREALALLQPPVAARRLQPNLVLLDLELPVVDGFEVLRRLRADPATQAIPVAVLTASLRDTDRERAFALGADAFHRKPVEFPELSAIVESLAQRWLGTGTGTEGR